MKAIYFLPILLATSVTAQVPDSSSALFSMREAEHNFARASVMYGRNEAFVQNFADESVIFADKWLTNGKQFWEQLKASPIVLKWEPEFMDISESRDFGISTGPWDLQEYRPYTSPIATGYFLTVWKRQAGGVWKVILDAGSTTPPLKSPHHNFLFPPGADKLVSKPPVIRVELSCRELLDRDKEFQSEWKKSPEASTYISFLGPKARIQLSGHIPTTDTDTITGIITRIDKKLTWKPIGEGAAGSGDLGFTYGLLEIPGNNESTKGHYVRIWRKYPGAGWKISLDMININ